MNRALLLGIMVLLLQAKVLESRPAPPLEARKVTPPAPTAQGRLLPYSPQFISVHNETTYFGGTVWAADSLRWEAVKDSVWTFDTGVGSSIKGPGTIDPDVDPFKQAGLHARMEGWVGLDRTHQSPQYFRRVGSNDPRWMGDVCAGSTGGLGGTYSFWAGLFASEARDLCYAAGQGYGNGWTICISRSFTYSGGNVTLEYDWVIDSEPGFDFGGVTVDSGDGKQIGVVQYDNAASGHQLLSLRPGLELPSQPGEIKIRFCFESDGAWSDQDGEYPSTCGGFAVDNIAMAGGITYFEDFETDEGGWILTEEPGRGGDWSHLAFLSDLPPVSPEATGTCIMEDSVLVFFDPIAGGSPIAGEHPLYQDNLALSPWIDLQRGASTDKPGRVIQYSGYFDLPLLNYIFVQVYAQWYPDTCSITQTPRVSDLTSTGFLSYFGGYPKCLDYSAQTNLRPGESQGALDFTDIIPPTAEEVRIGLGVISYCSFFAGCTQVTNTTPWFDNVRFGVHTMNPIQPVLDAAASGDTVWIPRGNYYGPGNRDLDLGGKNLVLIGAEGPDRTFINCQGQGRGILLNSGQDSTTVVEGLTIQAGRAPRIGTERLENGGGILVSGRSSPVLRNCSLMSNSGGHGGGVFVDFGSTVRIEDCRFNMNRAFMPGSGPGLGLGGAVASFGEVVLDNCDLIDNSADEGGAVGTIGPTLVRNSRIRRNYAEIQGGGIFSRGGSFIGCTISENNAAVQGGGIAAWPLATALPPAPLEFIDCLVVHNNADVHGGGVHGGSGTVLFQGCTFSANEAPVGGGAFIDNTVSMQFLSSILWGNCADGPGSEVYLADTSGVVRLLCSALDLPGLAGPGVFDCDGPQVFEDPLFCETGPCYSVNRWERGDFRLSANSPCLPQNSPCGNLIGALAQTCSGDTILVEPPAPPPAPAITACPNPFTREVRLDFVSAAAAKPTIQVFDLQGRLIKTFTPPVSEGFVNWDGCDELGRRGSSGVYFVRLTAGPVRELRRVVLLPSD